MIKLVYHTKELITQIYVIKEEKIFVAPVTRIEGFPVAKIS